ncbi:MAG: hypothetical protein ACRD1Q_07695 [Vicinamibacterales bacterium]
MSQTFFSTFAVTIVLTAGAVTIAAPGQNTERPGYPTRPSVWVENRGPAEAVPIVLQGVATTAPLPVEVVGTPTVAIGTANAVQARRLRQQWEYSTISAGRGQDIAAALNSAGMEGWELSMQLPDQTGTVLVLMRPR